MELNYLTNYMSSSESWIMIWRKTGLKVGTSHDGQLADTMSNQCQSTIDYLIIIDLFGVDILQTNILMGNLLYLKQVNVCG